MKNSITTKDFFKGLEILKVSNREFKEMCKSNNFKDNVVYKLLEPVSLKGSNNLYDPEEVSLPKNLWTTTGLIITNYKIQKMPTNLRICGPLLLPHTQIITMPKNLEIIGDFGVKFISKNNKYPSIYKIPENAYYDLTEYTPTSRKNNHSDSEVGSELMVGPKSLNLSFSQIKYLPKGFILKGSGLILYGAKLKEIKSNVKIDGMVVLSKTPINNLPNDMQIGGHLIIDKTDIEILPDNFSHIRGDFIANNTPLKKMPNEFKVDGEISLVSCWNLKNLSKILKTGALKIIDTPIETIPDSVCKLKYLIVQRTNIKKLPKKLVVKGHIDLRQNASLQILPKDIRCKSLLLRGTSVYDISLTTKRTFIEYPEGYWEINKWHKQHDIPKNAKLTKEELILRKIQVGI